MSTVDRRGKEGLFDITESVGAQLQHQKLSDFEKEVINDKRSRILDLQKEY